MRRRELIAGLMLPLMLRNGLVEVSTFREEAADGALIAYGADLQDMFRRTASYVDKILKGPKAADIPVEFPTRYALVVKVKTAIALGLTVPPTLLARADEVIE